MLASILIFRNPSIGIHVHLPMKEELENELKEIDKGFHLLQTRRLEVKEKLFRLKWGFGKGSTVMLDGVTMIVDQVDMWATCRKITKKGLPSLTATTLYSNDLPKVKIIVP